MKEMGPKPPEHEDRKRLERLLETVEDYELKTSEPPAKLYVELDGETLEEWGPKRTPELFTVPHWGETLRLTDEAGTTRAYIYLPDQVPGKEKFDKGRIALEIEQDDRGYLTFKPKVSYRKD